MTVMPSVMIELKQQTAELHTYAEQRPLQRAMLKGTLAREAYAAYLGQLMWVHRTLESAIDDHRHSHPAFDSVLRPYQQRHNDLLTDLAFLGVEAANVQPLPATQRVMKEITQTAEQHPVALLGMMYVLEGSNNGSKYIAKSIMRAFEMQPGPGVSYLDPYGEQQMPRWLDFKRDMDAAGFSDAECGELVAAAKVMFQCIADVSDEVLEPVAA